MLPITKYQKLYWCREYKHCQIHQSFAICIANKETILTKEVGGIQWVQNFLLG